MLHIVNLEEIQDHVLKIPALVDQQDRREARFVQDVKSWLSKLEEVLDNNKMPAAGKIAAIRSALVSAERGVMPAGIGFNGEPSRHNVKEATAGYAIQQANDVVFDAIQKDRDRVFEAERLVRQLVALARTKGLIATTVDGRSLAESVRDIWQKIGADKDLSPGTTNVEGLVGPYDALIVLDRIIAVDVLRR